MRYRAYSSYLKEKYGERVYKLPVNLPLTCPNRDGCVGSGGCIFCGEEGAAFENLSATMCIAEQIEKNKAFIGKKYKVKKFIVYFQNFTNTYMPLDKFKDCIHQAIAEDVVEIAVSTRPDCIAESYLEFLADVSRTSGICISFELGLQTVNYKTLAKLNRGHSLAEFIDAVGMIHRYGFSVCAHLILNLPWDDTADVIECAKVLSALRVEQVKLHSLYIVKGTPMAQMYLSGDFSMGTYYDYVDRVIAFLEYLDPKIVIQRLIGRAGEERTVFSNYGTSWWKIKDNIDAQLELRDSFQGKRFGYLGGSALRNKFE